MKSEGTRKGTPRWGDSNKLCTYSSSETKGPGLTGCLQRSQIKGGGLTMQIHSQIQCSAEIPSLYFQSTHPDLIRLALQQGSLGQAELCTAMTALVPSFFSSSIDKHCPQSPWAENPPMAKLCLALGQKAMAPDQDLTGKAIGCKTGYPNTPKLALKDYVWVTRAPDCNLLHLTLYLKKNPCQMAIFMKLKLQDAK